MKIKALLYIGLMLLTTFLISSCGGGGGGGNVGVVAPKPPVADNNSGLPTFDEGIPTNQTTTITSNEVITPLISVSRKSTSADLILTEVPEEVATFVFGTNLVCDKIQVSVDSPQVKIVKIPKDGCTVLLRRMGTGAKLSKGTKITITSVQSSTPREVDTPEADRVAESLIVLAPKILFHRAGFSADGKVTKKSYNKEM